MRRVIPVPEDIAVAAAPIDRNGFAPFGTLVDVEMSGMRTDRIDGIENRRPNALFHLSTVAIEPTPLPLAIVELERHVFTSQTFLPFAASRYLICVAADDAHGGPDLQTLRAFTVPSGVGITYRPGTWHHPMVALDAPASFAIIMWCGEDANEEFVGLSRPIGVHASGAPGAAATQR